MRLVLDTNVWLDWLVFSDPHVAPIRALVESGTAALFLDAACTEELERALAYPFRGTIAAPDVRRAHLDTAYRLSRRPDVRAAVDAMALPACRDPDDQKFLELARDCGADWLVTRDKALLACSRRGDRRLPFRIGTPKQFCEALPAMA